MEVAEVVRKGEGSSSDSSGGGSGGLFDFHKAWSPPTMRDVYSIVVVVITMGSGSVVIILPATTTTTTTTIAVGNRTFISEDSQYSLVPRETRGLTIVLEAFRTSTPPPALLTHLMVADSRRR